MSTTNDIPILPDQPEGFVTEIREASPTHFLLKIKSFSLLSKSIERYESNDFEAEGYNWKLILYPKGNKGENVEDHISLYLCVSEKNDLKLGWEINAVFKLFVFDQIHDNYLTVQGRATRFHAMRTQWGIAKFITLSTLIEPTNGYIVDDTCVLGAEVFVAKRKVQGECLVLQKPASYKYEWKAFKSSSSYELLSNVFIAGDHKWRIKFYPEGNSDNRGQNASIFLDSVQSLSDGHRVLVECTLSIKNANNCRRFPRQARFWFNSTIASNGWSSFLPLQALKDYTVENCYNVEAEVTVLSVVDKLY